jgi:diguanylate cyclase (GGDEF)-like protein
MLTARDRQALLDLAHRARGGAYVHLPVWLLVSLWAGLHLQAPLFFAVNSLLFAATTAFRVSIASRFTYLLKARPEFARKGGFVAVLAPCVHWGILAALADHWSVLRDVATPLQFVVIALAGAGTNVFAINKTLRVLYPACALVPGIVAFVIGGNSQSMLLAVMGLAVLLYIFKSTETLYVDYWAAADGRRELESRARDLEKLSITDALTQIPNRMYFQHRLNESWAAAARDSQPLSLMLIDLDHFKVINDTHGHATGDQCLQAAAKALRAALHQPWDLLARYGGEEFAVLLEDVDAPRARLVAQRLLRSVESINLRVGDTPLRIACSIGVTTRIPQVGLDPSMLVVQADNALYEAKEQGRNRVVVAAGAA